MEIRKLEIRRLKEEELESALSLVLGVFEREIKPSYTEEGVQEFLKFINYDFMRGAYTRGEIIFWGAFTDELIGTVAVRPDGHICLFFVKNEYQGLGIGKALFQMMYNYCVEELHVKKITVNAAPQSVAKYIHMGMRQIGNMEERNGIRSVPMEMYASPTLVKPVQFQEKKDRNKFWIILTILLALLLAASIFLGVRMIKNVIEFSFQEDSVRVTPEEFQEPELSGVNAIPAYVDDYLSYEIEGQSYNFIDDEKINTIIEFGVQYPELKGDAGFDQKLLEKINQTLKDKAMETVEEIYEHPSEEIKETVLQADTPVLVSYVTYKVTYASDEVLSIVMEDQGYKGSEEQYFYDFRTITVDLNTGEVYELEDIIDIDKAFVKKWIRIMRDEADDDSLLSELNTNEMMSALEGETFEGVYDVEYFFDEEGIEIGFSFDYEDEDPDNSGFAWVTAPFSYKEIENFTTDSPIWDEMN